MVVGQSGNGYVRYHYRSALVNFMVVFILDISFEIRSTALAAIESIIYA